MEHIKIEKLYLDFLSYYCFGAVMACIKLLSFPSTNFMDKHFAALAIQNIYAFLPPKHISLASTWVENVTNHVYCVLENPAHKKYEIATVLVAEGRRDFSIFFNDCKNETTSEQPCTFGEYLYDNYKEYLLKMMHKIMPNNDANNSLSDAPLSKHADNCCYEDEDEDEGEDEDEDEKKFNYYAKLTKIAQVANDWKTNSKYDQGVTFGCAISLWADSFLRKAFEDSRVKFTVFLNCHDGTAKAEEVIALAYAMKIKLAKKIGDI